MNFTSSFLSCDSLVLLSEFFFILSSCPNLFMYSSSAWLKKLSLSFINLSNNFAFSSSDFHLKAS
jgi:hypothetical protein